MCDVGHYLGFLSLKCGQYLLFTIFVKPKQDVAYIAINSMASHKHMIKIIHYHHSSFHGNGCHGLSETDPRKATPEYEPWREGLIISTHLSLNKREDGSHEVK